MRVVDTPTGAVTIFEPSVEDMEQIMAMDDLIAAFNQDPGDDNNVEINGTDILKQVIPMLTDLEFDADMTDEEMTRIIDHPSVWLRQILGWLTRIVTGVYRIMILNFYNNLDMTDMVNMSEELSDQVLNRYIECKSRTDEGRQQIQKINEQSDKIIQMTKAQNKKAEQERKQKAKEDSESKVQDYADADILKPDNYTKSIEDEVKSRFSDLD